MHGMNPPYSRGICRTLVIALCILHALCRLLVKPPLGLDGETGLPSILLAVSTAGLLTLLSLGMGNLLLRKSGLLTDCVILNTSLALAAGYAMLSLCVFAGLTAPGGLNIGLPPALLIMGLGAWELFSRIHLMIPHGPGRDVWKGATPLWSVLLAILALTALYMALTPPYSWDAQVYHLPIPAAYLEHRHFVPIPFNVYSNMPLAVDLLYVPALMLGGDIAAGLVHFALGCSLVMLLYSAGRKWFSPEAGLIAALLFFCHPMVFYEWSVAFIDIGVALFFLGAGICAFLWAETKKTGYAAVSGVLAGIGMGSKYTMVFGGLSLLLMYPFLPYILPRKGGGKEQQYTRRDVAAAFIAYGLAATLSTIPWLIKNTLYTGNPVYPLLYGIFGGRDWSAIQSKWLLDWQRSIGMGREPLDYLLLPFRVFFLSDLTKGYRGFAGTLYPYILILSPAVFALKDRGRRVALTCLVLFALFFIFWSLGAQQVRFLFPALAFLALCSGAAAAGLKDRSRIGGLVAGCLIMAACIHLCVGHIRTELRREGSFLRVILGRQTRTEFMRERLRTYPCMEYVRREAPGERILLLFENRVWYASGPSFADSMFEASHILAMAHEAGDPHRLAKRIEDLGTKYVIVDEIIRAGVGSLGDAWVFSREENIVEYNKALDILNQYMSIYLTRVYEENQASVYVHKQPATNP